MDDAKLKKLIENDLEKDAERIMEEVNADPSLKDIKVPDDIHDNLMKRIREYEEKQAEENLSEENKELIRYGRIYKKNRKRNRILVALVAILIIATLGITSMGGPNKLVETVKRMVSGREQTNIQVGEEEIDELEIASEEEAYQAIEDAFQITPVRLYYLPDEMNFTEIVIEKEIQNARIIYEKNSGETITYSLWFNYREGAVAVDVEDEFLKVEEKEVMGHSIILKQYSLENSSKTRWQIEFQDGKTYASIMMYGLTEAEANQVADNLYFSK